MIKDIANNAALSWVISIFIIVVSVLLSFGFIPTCPEARKLKKFWRVIFSISILILLILAGLYKLYTQDYTQKELEKSQSVTEALIQYPLNDIGITAYYDGHLLSTKFVTYLLYIKKTEIFYNEPSAIIFINELWKKYLDEHVSKQQKKPIDIVKGGIENKFPALLAQRLVVNWLAWLYYNDWKNRIMPGPVNSGWSLMNLGDAFTVKDVKKIMLNEWRAQFKENPFMKYSVQGENESISVPPQVSIFLEGSYIKFQSPYLDAYIKISSPGISILRPMTAMSLHWDANAMDEVLEAWISIELRAVFHPEKMNDPYMKDYRNWILNVFRDLVYGFRWEEWSKDIRMSVNAKEFQLNRSQVKTK